MQFPFENASRNLHTLVDMLKLNIAFDNFKEGLFTFLYGSVLSLAFVWFGTFFGIKSQ